MNGSTKGNDAYAARRREMVERQIASRGVRDPAVLQALRTVPREVFVPGHLQDFAYDDTPLPIEEGQTISQPYIVALMAAALDLAPGDRVLEIGAGSGYAAAVLSRMAGSVYGVERHGPLVESARRRIESLGYDNVELLHDDGTLGWPEHAPYDAIIVSAGGPTVPHTLLEQLRVGGRLVLPVGTEPREQELLLIQRTGPNDYDRQSLGRVMFVPLVGTKGGSAVDASAAPPLTPKPVRTKPRPTLSPPDETVTVNGSSTGAASKVTCTDQWPLPSTVRGARASRSPSSPRRR